MASSVYLALLEEMRQLHMGKSRGYGGSDAQMAWSNFLRSRELGVDPATGCLVRLSDKFVRLASLVRDPANDQVGESIEDTAKDLAAYALIFICLRRHPDEPAFWPQDVSGVAEAWTRDLYDRAARADLDELATRAGDPATEGERLPRTDLDVDG